MSESIPRHIPYSLNSVRYGRRVILAIMRVHAKSRAATVWLVAQVLLWGSLGGVTGSMINVTWFGYPS